MLPHQWFIELDMFFRQEIMRVANGHFPYMEDFIIVFRSRLGDAGQVVALVVVDVSVVSQFCLMKCTFVDETVLFQYFLRTFVVRITGRCDEAKPQFFKAIVEDTLHCFGHVSFAPIRFVEPVTQHSHLRIFAFRVGDNSYGTD